MIKRVVWNKETQQPLVQKLLVTVAGRYPKLLLERQEFAGLGIVHTWWGESESAFPLSSVALSEERAWPTNVMVLMENLMTLWLGTHLEASRMDRANECRSARVAPAKTTLESFSAASKTLLLPEELGVSVLPAPSQFEWTLTWVLA